MRLEEAMDIQFYHDLAMAPFKLSWPCRAVASGKIF